MNFSGEGLPRSSRLFTFSHILTLLLPLFIGINFANAAIPAVERQAVIAFCNSTDGDNCADNSGWITLPLDVDGFVLRGTENTWYGISCDAGNTKVQLVVLQMNQLSGFIPTEISNLSNLRSLNLAYNQLSGSIPNSLCNMTELTSLVSPSTEINVVALN